MCIRDRDSNRPNVMNFINIGGSEAKKFVLQALGRGVRIEPTKGRRNRLPATDINKNHLLETLFVFATDNKGIQTVLELSLIHISTMLKENGSMWLHLDENANVYGKKLIENYFNDITEIIFDTNATKDEEADLFGYKSFGDNFQLKHQTLYYARNEESYKFNKLWKPNRNMTQLNIGWLDLISVPKDGKKAKKIKDNNYYIEKWIDGSLVFEEIDISDEKIFPVGDIWNDIFSFTQSEMRVSESFSFTSSQKPENLLRRIIQSSTNQGDLVLDYFLGIGTTIAVTHKLNKK